MELRNCPFCGSEDVDLYIEDGYYDVACVVCKNCGGRSGRYEDENEAIVLWNGESSQQANPPDAKCTCGSKRMPLNKGTIMFMCPDCNLRR